VANFTTASQLACDNIRSGLQHFVPDDIAIRDARDVPSDFHATYSAKRKRYRYVIHNSRTVHPHLRRYAWRLGDELDVAAMHAAGQVLLGKHDFRSFESHFPNKATSVRTVMELCVRRCAVWSVWQPCGHEPIGDRGAGEFIVLDIVADGFLYNMVRSIVGTLLKSGRRQWTAEDVRHILTAQDRSQAGETAPPQGLYLVSVDYEDS
jgi:tRNA pseudouridine38-40 synthase